MKTSESVQVATSTTNPYESFRPKIGEIILDTVVKNSKDGLRVSYDWGIGKVFRITGEACGFQNPNVLPDEFKKIVRFEFNKLKDKVLNKDGFELSRSREGFKLVPDGIAELRTDTFVKTAISLERQLELAIKGLASVTASLSTATAEKAVNLKRKQVAFSMRIDYFRQEIARQKELVEVVNKVNVEGKLEIK